MDLARRADVSVTIGGHDATSYISPSLLSFSYSDNASGKADSIQLELHDRDGKWAEAWAPEKGTDIQAAVTCINWVDNIKSLSLSFGAFVVDSVEHSGPPDKISIKAVSASLNSDLRDTKRTKAWEAYDLERMANEIATKYGLVLLYTAPTYTFARMDQREESDLAFITRLATERGVLCKVHDGKMALYDGVDADAQATSFTIAKRGGQFSPKSYNFTRKSHGTAYSTCSVAYLDPSTETTITATYDVSGNVASATGTKNLLVNQRVESEAEAKILAQKSLRRANAAECTGSLEIMGHPYFLAGITIELTGFGTYSGQYFVESVEHRVGDGYTCSAKIRSVLEY